MDWIQVLTIVATLLGGIFYIHNAVKDLKSDIKQQNSRTDRLYEMFIELLKEKK